MAYFSPSITSMKLAFFAFILLATTSKAHSAPLCSEMGEEAPRGGYILSWQKEGNSCKAANGAVIKRVELKQMQISGNERVQISGLLVNGAFWSQQIVDTLNSENPPNSPDFQSLCASVGMRLPTQNEVLALFRAFDFPEKSKATYDPSVTFPPRSLAFYGTIGWWNSFMERIWTSSKNPSNSSEFAYFKLGIGHYEKGFASYEYDINQKKNYARRHSTWCIFR